MCFTGILQVNSEGRVHEPLGNPDLNVWQLQAGIHVLITTSKRQGCSLKCSLSCAPLLWIWFEWFPNCFSGLVILKLPFKKGTSSHHLETCTLKSLCPHHSSSHVGGQSCVKAGPGRVWLGLLVKVAGERGASTGSGFARILGSQRQSEREDKFQKLQTSLTGILRTG